MDRGGMSGKAAAEVELGDGVVECRRRKCLFEVQGGAVEKVEETRGFDGRVVRNQE